MDGKGRLANRVFVSACAASLLAHALLLALLRPGGLAPAAEKPPAPRSLALSLPPPPPPPPPPQLTETPRPLPASDEVQAPAAEPEQARPAPPVGDDFPQTPPRPPLEEIAEAPGTSPDSEEEASISPARLKESISAFVEDYRSALARQWVQDCQRRRNAEGRRDCPKADLGEAPARRQAREAVEQVIEDRRPELVYSPLMREFERENAALRPLIEEGGLVGELAETRFELNRQKLLYLNQQFSTGIPGWPVITRICIPMPCVYRYTGYEVERPEEEEGFELAPPLFPVR